MDFISALSHKFALKDLISLHYFFGIEVVPTFKGLFLSQHQFINDALKWTNMAGAKESHTPLSTLDTLFDGYSGMDAEK